MTKSGTSLFYFGCYVVLSGLIIIIMPETFISLNQLPEIPNGWTRVFGLIVLVVGTYDIVSGRGDVKLLIKASVYVRFGFALGVTLLVVSGQMPVTLITFGIADVVGALWTIIALKSEMSKN